MLFPLTQEEALASLCESLEDIIDDQPIAALAVGWVSVVLIFLVFS